MDKYETRQLWYVCEVCHTSSFHIRALRHIRPCLIQDAAATLAFGIVGICLDYCNAAIFGTSNHNNVFKTHLLRLYATQCIKPALNYYCNNYTGYRLGKEYDLRSHCYRSKLTMSRQASICMS